MRGAACTGEDHCQGAEPHGGLPVNTLDQPCNSWSPPVTSQQQHRQLTVPGQASDAANLFAARPSRVFVIIFILSLKLTASAWTDWGHRKCGEDFCTLLLDGLWAALLKCLLMTVHCGAPAGVTVRLSREACFVQGVHPLIDSDRALQPSWHFCCFSSRTHLSVVSQKATLCERKRWEQMGEKNLFVHKVFLTHSCNQLDRRLHWNGGKMFIVGGTKWITLIIVDVTNWEGGGRANIVHPWHTCYIVGVNGNFGVRILCKLLDGWCLHVCACGGSVLTLCFVSLIGMWNKHFY